MLLTAPSRVGMLGTKYTQTHPSDFYHLPTLTECVITFFPVSDNPLPPLTVTHKLHPFQHPLPYAKFRSVSRYGALFTVGFMYFLTT